MTKQFAMIVGWVLILVGVLNFFVEPIKLMPVHGVIHIVAGFLGVALVKKHKGFTMWVGIVGIVLAAVGLMTKEVLGLVDLPTWITVVHAALGVLGLIVWAGARGKMMPAAPMGTSTPPTAPTGGQM